MSDVLQEKDKSLAGVSQKLIEEAKKTKDQEYKPIIEKLMSDIQNRVEKVLQLEMDLDMQQDEYA